jgi:hypothetical protein
MALQHSPSIVTSGLILCLDAPNPRSYPGSGTTWYDVSGNQILATLVNSPTMGSQGVTLNGTNNYVTIAFNSLFNFTSNPFTVLAWNNTISTDTVYNGIITADLAGDSTWKILKDIGNSYYASRSGSTILPFDNYTPGKFHCYAYTKSGTTMINYMDGAQVNSTSSATDPTSFSNNLALGSYRLNDAIAGIYLTNQTIGQILLYNKVLSASEITQNFNALRGRYGV